MLVPVSAADLADLLDVLIDNVFAHTPDGTGFSVTLRGAAAEGGTCALTVADDGPGWSAEPRPGPGRTGLGLDIARRTAQDCGGHLVTGTTARAGRRSRSRCPWSPRRGEPAGVAQSSPPPSVAASSSSVRAVHAGASAPRAWPRGAGTAWSAARCARPGPRRRGVPRGRGREGDGLGHVRDTGLARRWAGVARRPAEHDAGPDGLRRGVVRCRDRPDRGRTGIGGHGVGTEAAGEPGDEGERTEEDREELHGTLCPRPTYARLAPGSSPVKTVLGAP